MAAKLYAVHGSHPCDTVERALQLKGIGYDIVELPPPAHALIQRMVFGERTVPGIKLESGEKIQGSRKIVRRLEELRPEPALYGSPEIDEAERWGDEVLQSLTRRVLWPALKASPAAMRSFQEGGKLPPLPGPVIRAAAPLVTRIEFRLNAVRPGTLEADLAALPGHLDHVDGLIADGVIGGERPNAADLQIAPSIRLLYAVGDLRPMMAGRPGLALAQKLFPGEPGYVPPGALPV